MPDHLTQIIRAAGAWETAQAACRLTYDARFLRRKVIETTDGQTVLVDLAQTTSLNHGDALESVEGVLIEVIAADEDLMQVTGENLVQLAWHIGNRHTPCQIEAACLLIQTDPVIGHMLEHLGATVTPVHRSFTPEGGAYGHGRTHSHAHGATAHDHDHAQDDGHTHGHSHDHDHAH